MLGNAMYEDEAAVEPIAVIGMACRVPGASDLSQYWSNLRDGIESIRFFDREDALAAGASVRAVDDPQHVRAAPILDDIEGFDAGLFNCTRREAEILDPQHRVLLECASAALDHAGYDPGRYEGDIGVYAGVGSGEYQWYHLLPDKSLVGAVGHMAIALANNTDYAATLVAYKMNLRGPALSVSTACSTGLVAVHLACEAVRNGECDMALAGAASVELMQWHGYIYQEGGILSPDGHCRAFDQDAKGTLWGSGGGVVVLKRLSEALADGDTVHGVILGSAINNDGSDKVGFSAPSVSGQSAVIRQALGVAGVHADSIDYIEAHGTGTNVGDPIEVRALSAALGTTREPQSCLLGSVKPNIGHLAAAAGVAGLIKTVLALENETIPPTLHFQQPNPAMNLEATALRVASVKHPWARGSRPRRAGISSFGMGGTNAHAIVQEAPLVPVATSSGRPQILVVSAKTPSALDRAANSLAETLRAQPELSLDDVAYTLQDGRRRLPYRRAFLATDLADAAAVLEGAAPRRLLVGKAPVAAEAVFLLPGQGTQRAGMAADLYAQFDVLRRWVDTGAELLLPILGFDVRDLLVTRFDADSPTQLAADERLRHTGTTQPALFVFEFALAKLWESWGVQPKAMVGHSLGEYVACCLAGVFSFEDGVRVVATRAALMESIAPGSMIAVPMDEQSLELPGTGVELAAVNAPMACVVSGPIDRIDTYEAALVEEGVPVTRLRTSHGFHSSMFEPVRSALAAAFEGVALRRPAVPVVSNVTGTWLTAEQATDPQYWAEHMCRPVQFAAGLQVALADRSSVLVEVGPGNALSGLARMQLPTDTPDPVPTLPAHCEDGGVALLEAVARAWALGLPVDFTPGRVAGRRRIPLPGHPFERQRYWIEGVDPLVTTGAPAAELPEGRHDPDDWYWVPTWRQTAAVAAEMPADGTPWLVLRDGAGHVDRFVARLREEGATVVTVTSGDGYAGTDGDYTVRCDEPGDFERLVADLVTSGKNPGRVVHAMALGEAPADLLDREAARRIVSLTFTSSLHLVQALAGQGLTENLDLTFVTRDAQAVVGGDVRTPAAAVLAGPARTLPMEFVGVTCRQVDVDDPGLGTRAILDAVAAEDPVQVIAYRRGRRWLAGVEQAPVADAATGQARLRDRGVYLLTGGLGGVGLSIAEDLVRRVRARVVLLGRSPLPARSTWDERIAAGGRQGRQLATLLRIEELGGEVLALAADVTDPEQLADARQQVLDRYGEINGIVHAAGIAGGTMVEAHSAKRASTVLEPKIFGTLALAQAFQHDALDFLALCSSVTALAGGLGQLDYCAGNAFLDAFAHAADGAPWPVLSINWGAWLEVGMAVETAVPNALLDVERTTSATVERRLLAHPLLGESEQAAGSKRLECTTVLGPGQHWVLDEHRILGTPAMPGTGYLEMVRAAFAQGDDSRPVELRDVVFLAPLGIPDDSSRTVRVLLEDTDGGAWRIESWAGSNWQEHARGFVAWAAPTPSAVTDLDAVIARCPNVRENLQDSASGLVGFGGRWSSLQQVRGNLTEELALLVVGPEVATDLPAYGLHPAVLDEATAFGDYAGASGSYLPLGYGRITVRRPMPTRLYSHLRHRDSGTGELLTCDITLVDEHGAVIADIGDFMLRRVEADELTGFDEPPARTVGETSAEHARPADLRSEAGIRPVEGAEAFIRALGSDFGPQVAVTALDLRTLLSQVRQVDRNRVDEDGPASRADGAEVAEGEYVPPSTELEGTLIHLWEEAMGITGIGIEHNFFELGGNSLVAAQLIARIRTLMGIKLPMRTIFQSPTVAGMAASLEASAEAVS